MTHRENIAAIFSYKSSFHVYYVFFYGYDLSDAVKAL